MILRKDRKYEVKVRSTDWIVYPAAEEWIKPLDSDLYPYDALKYKEFGNMNEFCRAINRRISPRRNDAFQFNYLIDHGKI